MLDSYHFTTWSSMNKGLKKYKGFTMYKFMFRTSSIIFEKSDKIKLAASVNAINEKSPIDTVLKLYYWFKLLHYYLSIHSEKFIMQYYHFHN